MIKVCHLRNTKPRFDVLSLVHHSDTGSPVVGLGGLLVILGGLTQHYLVVAQPANEKIFKLYYSL